MKRIRYLTLLLLFFVCLGANAQKGLAVQAAFDEFAVSKNATEVVMGAGRLKKYNLSLFHSLEIKKPQASEQRRIEALLQTDVAGAILNEESASHRLYELPRRGGMHRFIFYRCTDESLILIYIEGKASLKQIESHFLKKQK